MPVYEYECTKCGHHAEKLQKMTDPPITECAMCAGRMKKLISQSTFHLKGSGWYVTDYASKSGGYDGKIGNQGDKPSKESKESTKEAKSASEKPKTEASSNSGVKAKSKDV